MPELRRILATRSYAFALLLTICLLVANIAALPAFASPHNWAGTAAIFAPFAHAAMASTPAVVGGGIDLSIGPLIGLVNVVLVSGS
jgi:ribose transport system permease protein